MDSISSAKNRVSFYMRPEDEARVRAAYRLLHPGGSQGTLSHMYSHAILSYVSQLEARYNGGRPFPEVQSPEAASLTSSENTNLMQRCAQGQRSLETETGRAMRRSRVAIAAFAIALMAPMGATATATPPDPLDSDSTAAAVSYYANSEGVSIPVAKNIITDQESILKAATSAGIAFNGEESVRFESNGDSQTVIIRSEDEAKTRAITSTRISNNTTIVAEGVTDTPYISLEVSDETVQEIKKSVPSIQGVYVRESDGALMVDAATAADGLESRSSAQAITISGYPTTIVTYGDSASDSLSVRGGTGMSSCTAGLPAKYGSYIGFVSAAHCPASTRLFGNTSGTGTSVAATQRKKVHNANADIAFYSVSSSNALTKTRFAASSSTAVSVGNPMNVGTGLTACHRGKTMGWQCGKITSIAYKPTYAGACPGTTCNSVFYRVGAKQAGGDSGGPWSFNSSYIGIHKGGSSTYSIFSMISRAPSGVTVNR